MSGGHNNMNRAQRAWGAAMPDWIKVLAEQCDRRQSQAKVASDLECSATVVNQLLGRSYPGRVDTYEQKVRGVYMRAVVACPILGEIPTSDCITNQQRARTFKATNPLRVALRGACPTCPNREKETK